MDSLKGTPLLGKANKVQLELIQATLELGRLDLIVVRLNQEVVIFDQGPTSLLLESRKVTVISGNSAELNPVPQLVACREKAKDLNLIDIDLAKMQVRTACNAQRHGGRSAREELAERLTEMLGDEVDIDIQEVDAEEILKTLDEVIGKVSAVAQEKMKPAAPKKGAAEQETAPLFVRQIVPLEVQSNGKQEGLTLVVQNLTLKLSEAATRFAQRLNEQREKARDDEAHEAKKEEVRKQVLKEVTTDKQGGEVINLNGKVVREEDTRSTN